jgi:hypothetical protein
MSIKLGSNALVPHTLVRATAIFAFAVLASACGGADDDRPGYVGVDNAQAETHDLDNQTDRNNKPAADPGDRKECEPGDAKECRINLPSQGSVKNCVEGVRYCDDGHWSECEVH